MAKPALLRTTALFACACGFGAIANEAAADPPTPSTVLSVALGLGESGNQDPEKGGCGAQVNGGTGTGIAGADINSFIQNTAIGEQLRGICDPSTNIGSASSLGSSFSGYQATKTAAQFHLIRRRLDSRLRRRYTNDEGYVQLAALDSDASPSLNGPAPADALGWGAFGQLSYQDLDRDATAYESGFESKITRGMVGVDRAWDGGDAGAWVSYEDGDGTLNAAGGALIVGAPEVAQKVLSDPANIRAICGLTPGAGSISDKATGVGAFFGMLFGDNGFFDVAANVEQRDHDYTRDACAMEFPGTQPENVAVHGSQLVYDFGSGDLDHRVDDIFAGFISGSTSTTKYEFSGRVGFNIQNGNWLVSPRAMLTYQHTSTDAYTESGRSAITNKLYSERLEDILTEANGGVAPSAAQCTRETLSTASPGALGCLLASYSPSTASGLELAFNKQSQESLRLEIGGQIAHAFPTSFGAIVPRVEAYARHEFDDDRSVAVVRFAQDTRGSGAAFLTLYGDKPDSDDALLSLGVSAVFGRAVVADLEVTKLAFNDLLDSTTTTAQIRWRF